MFQLDCCSRTKWQSSSCVVFCTTKLMTAPHRQYGGRYLFLQCKWFALISSSMNLKWNIPNNKVHGPIWGQQDPGGPHVGPMNFAIWDAENNWEAHLVPIVWSTSIHKARQFNWEYLNHTVLSWDAVFSSSVMGPQRSSLPDTIYDENAVKVINWTRSSFGWLCGLIDSLLNIFFRVFLFSNRWR